MVTIERHIADQQHMHKESSGEFSRLLRDLTLAVRIITRDVRRAGLNDIFGTTGTENVHGEAVKKLDQYANDTIVRAMQFGGHLCAMASEESEGLIKLSKTADKGGYLLLFDPLDGSSNIETCAPIGTIFSVLKRITPDNGSDGTLQDLLQPGTEQVAAGYALYGSSTQLVYTTGSGTDIFTYDPTVGEFLLSMPNVRIPSKGKYYSINEGNSVNWKPGTRNFVEYLKSADKKTGRPYSLRYIGSAVADIHRTLIAGGLFMYPADNKSPHGKLRLMYEVNPLGMIVEQAGGLAVDGRNPVLTITPTDLHQRCALVCGSSDDVRKAQEMMAPDFD